eukprot:4243698-Pleurochrysis_carterae.AAC.1
MMQSKRKVEEELNVVQDELKAVEDAAAAALVTDETQGDVHEMGNASVESGGLFPSPWDDIFDSPTVPEATAERAHPTSLPPPPSPPPSSLLKRTSPSRPARPDVASKIKDLTKLAAAPTQTAATAATRLPVKDADTPDVDTLTATSISNAAVPSISKAAVHDTTKSATKPAALSPRHPSSRRPSPQSPLVSCRPQLTH